MYDLCLLSYCGNVKAYRTFGAVEVIVKTRGVGYEKGRGDTFKPKIFGKTALEGLFYKGNCLLGTV
jgi:hypothetical protein